MSNGEKVLKDIMNEYEEMKGKELSLYDKARFGSAFYEMRNYEELINKINENRNEIINPSRFVLTLKIGFDTIEEINNFKRLLKIDKPKEYQLDEQDWSGK